MNSTAQMKWYKNKKYIRHKYHEQHGVGGINCQTQDFKFHIGNYFGSDQVVPAVIVLYRVSFE